MRLTISLRSGRERFFHGTNVVYKTEPFVPITRYKKTQLWKTDVSKCCSFYLFTDLKYLFILFHFQPFWRQGILQVNILHDNNLFYNFTKMCSVSKMPICLLLWATIPSGLVSSGLWAFSPSFLVLAPFRVDISLLLSLLFSFTKVQAPQ